nr:ferric iron reductase [Bacillus pumilus]
MMTLYDGVYQFSPEACAFREDRKIEIDESLCSFVPLEGDRHEWREQAVHALFTECVTPLLDVLKRTSRLPYSILWENVAVRINSLYRKDDAGSRRVCGEATRAGGLSVSEASGW